MLVEEECFSERSHVCENLDSFSTLVKESATVINLCPGSNLVTCVQVITPLPFQETDVEQGGRNKF